MDWSAWLFGDPFDDGRAMLVFLGTVFVVSVGLALFRRRLTWSDAAMLAAASCSGAYFLIFCIRFGIGPLFVIGFGMLLISGSLVAFPTVGVIRLFGSVLQSEPRKG